MECSCLPGWPPVSNYKIIISGHHQFDFPEPGVNVYTSTPAVYLQRIFGFTNRPQQFLPRQAGLVGHEDLRFDRRRGGWGKSTAAGFFLQHGIRGRGPLTKIARQACATRSGGTRGKFKASSVGNLSGLAERARLKRDELGACCFSACEADRKKKNSEGHPAPAHPRMLASHNWKPGANKVGAIAVVIIPASV